MRILPVNWSEALVFDRPVAEVMATVARLAGTDLEEVRTAVMTAIAIGNRPDLELAFPDLAGANPSHGNCPFMTRPQ
ncbi:hypothetical protein E8F11_10465 [Pseudomonas sp. BN417]|uniref:hypothetical protein n=1 Tax=Pseudomonas sp. BN417 TaxID=2567890 RepID=UPI0024588BC9|nr:hypothetical protein [Pseudomonas sp. BN417]MDH4555595.1 hypothetical protein [Pseudomonas sp. BN417]